MRKRIIATLMLASMLIVGSIAALPVTAAADGSSITLGAGALTAGNKVYFGNQILWRVLHVGAYNELPVCGDGKALLISNDTLDSIHFNEVNNASPSLLNLNNWAGSNAQTWCSSYYTRWPTGIEKDAILATSVSETENYIVDEHGGKTYGTASLTDEHFFFLSAKEADTLFTDDNDRKASVWWWLRSPLADSNTDGGMVGIGGWVYWISITDTKYYGGARPAFNLNLNSVLFSSLISSSSNQYKLTLADASRTVEITSGKTLTRGSVASVTVPYTIEGDSNYVSLLITNKDDTWSSTDGWSSGAAMQYYETAKATAASGTVTFTLPDNYETNRNNWKVWLLAEKVNDGNYSNYASAPVSITIPPHIHSWSYTAGTGEKANTITATCTDGCPDGYDTNGITIKLNFAPPDEMGDYEKPSTTGNYTYDGIPKECTVSGYPDPAPDGLEPLPTVYYNGNSTNPPWNVSDSYDSASITWGTASVAVSFRIGQANVTLAPSKQTVELNGTVSSTVDDVYTYSGTIFENDKITYADLRGDTSAVTENGTIYFGDRKVEISDKKTDARTDGNYNVTYEVPADTLIVTPTTPVLDGTLTASAITYGQTLENSIISGTMKDKNKGTIKVAGTFTWKTPTNMPTITDSDSTEYEWTFTPDDTANYNNATGKLKVKVNPDTTAIAITSADHGWTYDGAKHTDETYTVTYGGENIAADATGKVFTLPTGDKVTITSTAAGVTDCADSTANNNTFTYALDHSNGYKNVSATFGTLTVGRADNPLTFAGTQTVSVSYGTAAQTATLAEAGNGGGEVGYAIQSQTNASGAVNYFTLDGTTLTLAAGTPVGSYTVVVRATAAGNNNYKSGYKDSTVTVMVDKAGQTAPAAPTEKSKTSTSVTLVKTDGYQYGLGGTNGITWYDSNVFSSLAASTEYTFYQRVAGDDNHEPSSASPGTKIQTTQYTLVYNSGGGTGEMAPIGVSENDTYKFPACTFGAPQHKKFDHWKMSGVDGIFYPDDQDHNTVQVSSNCANTDGIIIVTAHWIFTDSATVKTAPTAKNPIYNGNAQELVTGGVAENGTMNYAIGTDETTAPTVGWSESIPVATDVETFYVWYKAVGDSSHGDSEAACVTAEIKKRSVILTSENGEKTYDGSALTKPAVTVSGDGFVTGEVSDVKATGSVTKVAEGEVTNTITYTTGTPFKADNYTIQKNEGKLKITQKAVTATVTAVNRDYAAGNKSVSLTAGKVNDAVAGDNVTVDISAASGTMADDSAGTDKTVTVTGVKLGGTAAGNYTLSAQPTGVTVTINRITDPAVITETARVTVGGNTVDLSGNVTNAVGDVSYEFDGEANGCTLDGSRLTSGNTTGTCKVKVTIGDSTNYTGKTGTITVTVTDKTSAQLAVTQTNTVYGTALADPVWARPANPVKDAVISYSGTTTTGSAYGPDSKKPTEAGSYTVSVTEETIDTIYSGSANFTISKAANPATVAGTASIMRDGKTVDLAENVTRNGATGAVGYEISGEANGCSLDGSVLTSGTATGEVTVNVTVAEDANYFALAATPIIVTISDKNTQTITASDVTATYGDADKYVIASTDGDGAISYAVKAGSEDFISVDAATGALTIKAVPADRRAYVTVTASETASFNAATKDVTVTISPEGSSGEPSENPLTYNGNAQKLVTPGTADGGEFYYTLGEDGTTAPAFYLDEAKTQIDTARWSTSVPEGTNAGSYYVWYIVKGDANHNDSAEACVPVEMAKKELKITADAKSKTVGEADPALTWTAEGLVGSDTVSGALSRDLGEAAGTYQITQGTLSAGNNYAITFIPAVLTINKAVDPVPEPSSGGGGYYYGGGAVQNRPREPYSDVIGATATSCGDSSPERIHNIELVCEKLNGVILQPGETFSFNETVGPLTAEAGFEPAPVDPDDETTEEIGGGVSQVASTLYASSLFGLLETIERSNHEYTVSFAQAGVDADVSNPAEGGGMDLKFRNNRSEPIKIVVTSKADEARQIREITIELRSALANSDYMPVLFDNSWSGNSSSIPVSAIDYTRPGYRIVLDHEEQSFTDGNGRGIRTLTNRKILDAAGWLVSDEILNPRLPDGSYAMDTYYFHGQQA